MDKLDILNRDQFVEQLLSLTQALSANKASTCFALNGPWGSGKTFVLNMFQEQLEQIQSEETSSDRYFVIRYNCWKFDYYEEPLVAIVATMMSVIEEKTKLFPDGEEKRELMGMLKAVGTALLSIGNSTLQTKTGIDIQKVYETLRDGKKDGKADYEEEHNYDAYFSFNQVICKLAGLLCDLAKEHTLVFLVDELDRCLPEYAIKVLERLHHLTEDQSNIITIISMDKNQLMSSVRQIFGFESPEKYLEKFISFEVKLDLGTVSETISEKYADYIALFDKSLFPFDEPVEECLQALFKDIDIRTQEQLIERAMLAHKLLYSGAKDYSFMCMEVLLAVMICVYRDDSCFSGERFSVTEFNRLFVPTRKSPIPAFAEFFKNQLEKIHFHPGYRFAGTIESYVLPKQPNLYSAILFTWCKMHENNQYQYISKSAYENIANNHEELKNFAEMMKMISRD